MRLIESTNDVKLNDIVLVLFNDKPDYGIWHNKKCVVTELCEPDAIKISQIDRNESGYAKLNGAVYKIFLYNKSFGILMNL